MVYKRKQILTGLAIFICIAGLIIVLPGCGKGLPEDIKNKASEIPAEIRSVASRVKIEQDKYEKLTKSSEFRKVQKIAIREKWTDQFDSASDELQKAELLYKKEITPLIKKNRPDSTDLVRQKIIRVKNIIQSAENLSKSVFSRFSEMRNTIVDAENIYARSRRDAVQIFNTAEMIKTNSLEKAHSDFPDLKNKLDLRFAPISKLEQQSRNNLTIVDAAYKAHLSDSHSDYAAFTDSSKALSSDLDKIKELEKKFSSEIAQLYMSYTKILKDMKEEFFVFIKRESWNENSDFYNPGSAVFQRQVSLEAYEMLTTDNVGTIASITPGFTGPKFKNNIGSIWDDLDINPGERWPGRGHNAASFWVESSKKNYFHKYMLEQNGDIKESDWEKVSENFYHTNFEFLGMAILSKPYGFFEDELLTQAAPPGMSYVGNSRYGEWEQDDSGNSFWAWYGRYALFSTLFFPRPYYYHYNSWNSWHSSYMGRKPYFGKSVNGMQRFGTRGSYIKKSPLFQNSRFVRSGGLKAQSTSIRGSGANLRGGGPKNRGK